MPELQAQPSIAKDLRVQGHLQIIERLKALDLSKLLVYRIDTVDPSALVALAWQFDILSPLWALLAPGTEQRSLIQNAIALHRYHGTPFAIKQVLASLGYAGATLLEGQDKWGGTYWPPEEGWAVFRIVVPLLPGQGVSPVQLQQIIQAALFFKNTRSWLDSVSFTYPGIEELIALPTDKFILVGSGSYRDFGEECVRPHDSEFGLNLGGFYECYPTIVRGYDDHYNYGGGTYYGPGQPAGAEDILADGPFVITSGPHAGTYVSSPGGIALCVIPTFSALYVTDTGASRVVSYPYAGGAPIASIAGSATGLTSPTGTVVSGRVWVADAGANALSAWPLNANGNVAPTYRITGSATQLVAPIDVAVDAGGRIYVANRLNALAYALGATGNSSPVSILGAGLFLNAVTVAVDASGELFVGDSTTNEIYIYAAGAVTGASPVRTISIGA